MKKILGVITLANHGGLEIMGVDEGDEMITWRPNFGTPGEEVSSPIEYDEEGGPEFTCEFGTFKFDEILAL